MAIGENRWATREEAEQAIEEARRLGDEWAAAEYRVVEVR
jgi:transcription elongation GreA/GreB family factor